MQTWLKKLALPLWVGLFVFFLGVILPWQAGAYLHKNLAATLDRLAGNIHAHAELRDVQHGIWQSSATLLLRADWMREAVELHVHMRHGPWLGLSRNTHPAWGWFSLQTELPKQGGISLFPTQQTVEAWLVADMWGDFHLSANLPSRERLGSILLQSVSRQHTGQCQGELRLPGFKWLTPLGDLIVADVALRLNLRREHGQRHGDYSVDAVRAALLFQANTQPAASIHPLPASLLLELPRFDVVFAQNTQLNAAWASGYGANLAPFGQAQNLNFGRMNARLVWQDVDWDSLLGSLELKAWTGHTMRARLQALNTLAFALGRGDIRLESLELSRPQGRFLMSGHLRAHAPVLDWQDLELGLNAEMDRLWLVHWMLESGAWTSAQQASQQLDELRQQGWFLGESAEKLQATLNLWRGYMSLSDRRFSLQSALQ